MATRRNVKYSPIPLEEDDSFGEDADGNRKRDLRFDYMPKSLDKVPWKSIGLAIFLLFLGSTLFVFSYFIFTGHMDGDRSQASGLLFLGFLSFLPGTTRTDLIGLTIANSLPN